MRPSRTIVCCHLTVIAILAAASGCTLVGSSLVAGSTPHDEASAALPRPKPPRRTIQVEVLFVRGTNDDGMLRDDLWQEVDEQALDAERRRRLNANGIRAGVVTGELPASLAERFSPSAPADTRDVAGIDPSLSRRLLQLLPGKGSELVTVSRLPTLVVLEQCDGEVRGGTYQDATPQLMVDAHPAADGRVRLAVTPEIKHGPVEKTWEGEDGMFRLATGQRRHRMDHLAIDATIPANGLLLIGCAAEASSSVGDALLRDAGQEHGGTVRLIAIRPLARSVDPAFAASDAGGDRSAE